MYINGKYYLDEIFNESECMTSIYEECDILNEEVENINKKRSILQKSLDNLKYALKNKFNKAYAIINKIENEDDIYDELKKVLPSLKKTNTGYSYKTIDYDKFQKESNEVGKRVKYPEYIQNDQKCYNSVKVFLSGQDSLSNKKLIETQIKIMDGIVEKSKDIPKIEDYVIDKSIKQGELKSFALKYVKETKSQITSYKLAAFAKERALKIEISGTDGELNRLSSMKQTEDVKLCKKYLKSWMKSYKVLETIQIQKFNFLKNFLGNKITLEESYIEEEYDIMNEGFFKKKKKDNKPSEPEIKLSDDGKRKIGKLIEKELTPIIRKYNSKKKDIRKVLDDSIKNFDDEEYAEMVFGNYLKSGVPTLTCNMKYFSDGITIVILKDEDSEMVESLVTISKSIVDDFKPSNNISQFISRINCDHNGYITIDFNMEKCKEYLNESVIEESYKGEINMKNINSLANIAKYCRINNTSNKLRNDIIKEYTDIFNSLDTIDESMITKDISLLPVYKINEAVLKEAEYIKEGYAIDLDSLKYVVESKNVTLEEAVQEIKNVNDIEDYYPMYCVLPRDINEHMTLESFITLNNSLEEANINPVVTTNLRKKDWQNTKDIIKNIFTNPTKTGKFEKIRPRLLNMVNRCETLEEVNYLKKDLRAAKVQLSKLKQNKPEIAKQIDDHIKWLETDYMEALNNKAKEIKSRK